MNDLHDIGRSEYSIFDTRATRFVPRTVTRLNENEVRDGNRYFASSLCPHLEWRLPVESGAIIQEADENAPRVRGYTIKR